LIFGQLSRTAQGSLEAAITNLVRRKYGRIFRVLEAGAVAEEAVNKG
jgi:hypothetical protein